MPWTQSFRKVLVLLNVKNIRDSQRLLKMVLHSPTTLLKLSPSYSSISNSQNENSLEFGALKGFWIAGLLATLELAVGSQMPCQKHWLYNVLATQGPQNTNFGYQFLQFPTLRMMISLNLEAFWGVPDRCCWPRLWDSWLQKVVVLQYFGHPEPSECKLWVPILQSPILRMRIHYILAFLGGSG